MMHSKTEKQKDCKSRWFFLQQSRNVWLYWLDIENTHRFPLFASFLLLDMKQMIFSCMLLYFFPSRDQDEAPILFSKHLLISFLRCCIASWIYNLAIWKTSEKNYQRQPHFSIFSFCNTLKKRSIHDIHMLFLKSFCKKIQRSPDSASLHFDQLWFWYSTGLKVWAFNLICAEEFV